MDSEHPDLDESRAFSREEYVEAHVLIMPRRRAERFVDEVLLGPLSPEAAARHTYLGDDTMNLLSLISESCAERVRQLRGETPAQSAERINEFVQRTGVRAKW